MANRESFGGDPPCWEHLLDEEGRLRERAATPEIRVRRVYEPPSPEDGRRVLVDRLWPRGVAKAEAHLDAWVRDVAPSDALRRWYGHDPARWLEFERRYRAELAGPAQQAALDELAKQATGGPLTLLCAARDATHSNAAVIREVLLERLAGG